MLNFPLSTALNKNIPKTKFYEKADINSSLKESFINDIEKITWINKLSAKTLNIAKSNTLLEIEVFKIKLKTKDFNLKILEAIDKAVPYLILYVLEYQNTFKLMLAYKENANFIRYFASDFKTEVKLEIKGNKLDTVYQNFLEQLSNNEITAASETDLKTQIVVLDEIKKLENKILKLNKKIGTEKQLNRQMVLRNEIRTLEAKIKELKHG